jgi:hypothetical protein
MMVHSPCTKKSCELLYILHSAAAFWLLLVVQHAAFFRIDYNALLSIFVVFLVRRIRKHPSFFGWLMGLLATYVFCIADYLLILGLNRFVFTYQNIGGFHDAVDLFVFVPFFSMAPLYFVVQSFAVLFPLRPRPGLLQPNSEG